MLRTLLEKNRSYRRFDETVSIPVKELEELVEYARLSPAASNVQPLKYILCNDSQLNKDIFPCLGWAGYLRDWDGPVEGERPAAYIVILGDTQLRKGVGCDHGIASQSILLGAAEKGYGGCLIGSVQRDTLREVLAIPERFDILLVVALGQPKEQVVLEDAVDGDIKYYRDEQSVHHVPKRPLEELIVSFRN